MSTKQIYEAELIDPGDLGERGQAFWDQVTDKFDFSDSEQQLLLEACRCVDQLETLERVLREQGTLVEGSKGQLVLNPAISETRQQRLVLHRLLAALRLEDEEGNDEGVASARSISAQTAANVRWNRRVI